MNASRKNTGQLFQFSLSLFLCYVLLACSSSGGSDPDNEPENPQGYVYQAPMDTGDGWTVGDLNQLNIDPQPIETLINNIEDDLIGFKHIDSLVIVQNGKLLLDKQFERTLDFVDDWAENQDLSLHATNSATKSFNSALIGIAIEQGYIEDVNIKIYDQFQHKLPIDNYTDSSRESKDSVTLENWLTMQHGYDWPELGASVLDNVNSEMNQSDDLIKFLLGRPMVTEPGTTFSYSTGVAYGLGRLLQNATGQSVVDFLTNNLLTPLNISSFDYWEKEGQLHTGSALYLKTRDMAKFGQLFLDGGVWNEQRIISQEWVAQSTEWRVNLTDKVGYGYQWWMYRYAVKGTDVLSYRADGWGGQFIIVFPALDLVITMTGSAYLEGEAAERDILSILENDLLPSFMD